MDSKNTSFEWKGEKYVAHPCKMGWAHCLASPHFCKTSYSKMSKACSVYNNRDSNIGYCSLDCIKWYNPIYPPAPDTKLGMYGTRKPPYRYYFKIEHDKSVNTVLSLSSLPSLPLPEETCHICKKIGVMEYCYFDNERFIHVSMCSSDCKNELFYPGEPYECYIDNMAITYICRYIGKCSNDLCKHLSKEKLIDCRLGNIEYCSVNCAIEDQTNYMKKYKGRVVEVYIRDKNSRSCSSSCQNKIGLIDHSESKDVICI